MPNISAVCYGSLEYGFAECDAHNNMVLTITISDKARNVSTTKKQINVTGSEYGY